MPETEELTTKQIGTVLDLTASFPDVVKANSGVANLAKFALDKSADPQKKTPEPPTDTTDTDPVDPVEPSEEEPKNTFFSTKKPQSFKDMNEVNAYLEKTFSVKTPEDYGKFIKNVNNWRNESQKISEVTSELEAIKEGLSQMPPPLVNAMQAWAQNRDYMQTFRETAMMPDFSKPAEKQDKELIVNYFYPGKFTQEDFSEFEDNDRLQAAYDFAVKEMFPKAKEKIEEQYADLQRKADKAIEARTVSASGSIDYLKQTFPDVAPQRLRKIEQTMLKGDDQKILGLFKNADGTYKKDAAIKLAMAEYGVTDLQELRTIIEEMNDGKFKAVRGAPKTPDTPSSNRPVENKMDDFIKTFTGGADPYRNRNKS